MPKVTVVIPVYNRPILLKEAVTSVFEQSQNNVEIIIADDGSTDDTAIIAKELCAISPKDKTCKYLHFAHNGFPGAVRNKAVLQSNSPYLAFLDSDDTWTKDKLETQLNYMESNKYNISHTRETWQRDKKIVSQKGQNHKRDGNIFIDALKKCIIGPSTVMMHRDFLIKTGGFNEKIEIAEDYEYWLRITDNNEVGYIEKPLTIKRAGDWPQLSEKYGKIELYRIMALASLLKVDIPNYQVHSQYINDYTWLGFSKENEKLARKELIYKCRVWSAGCIKRNRLKEAEQFEKIIAILSSSMNGR